MLIAIYRLGSTDAVGIIGILNGIKGFKLAALLPSEGMAQIGGWVALRIIGDRLIAYTGEQILPNGIAVGISCTVFTCNVST